MRAIALVFATTLTAFYCYADAEGRPTAPKRAGTKAAAASTEKIQPPVKAERAPRASKRLEGFDKERLLTKKVTSHFERNRGRRIYVQVDKPLYTPGETIWIRSLHLATRDWSGQQAPIRGQYELVSPKGAVVKKTFVKVEGSSAHHAFEIPDGVQGGEYIVRVRAGQHTGERKVVVSTYDPPRIKKRLEFVRKAYGVGDVVKATIKIKRPTGEPLGRHPVRGLVTLDGAQLPVVTATTNDAGGSVLSFTLPPEMSKGDGLLTVLVDDGGVTESISKRIPIVLKKMQLSFFPEGGKLIEGLPSRVYFEAKNTLGKPADVAGRVVDDKGNVVARFESVDRGLGRFDFTPNTGRSYHAEILRPAGVEQRYAMPLPEVAGCVLRSYDDLDGQRKDLRVAVRCTETRKVVVSAMLREHLLDAAAVKVRARRPAIVYLKSKERALRQARGVARITVFDADLEPLAERIVFRNRRHGLKVKITPDKEGYVPREQVALHVETTDHRGNPMPADLALSVVDDTVISFADDKKGHLVSQLLLQHEVPGKIEEPKAYFDLTKKTSGLAMELLMGTRGWRTFEWKPVFAPVLRATAFRFEDAAIGGGLAMVPRAANRIGGRRVVRGKALVGNQRRVANRPRVAQKGGVRPRPPAARPRPVPPPRPPVALVAPRPAPNMIAEANEVAPVGAPEIKPKPIAMEADKDWVGTRKGPRDQRLQAVRVFPVPDYPADYRGPRTDFRETIFWRPSVRTDKTGRATVRFPVSDAVTSFRVFAEGVGGDRLGRAETVISSKLPFSMAVKLPLEVSEGDTVSLPLILTNEQSRALPISLSASFGDLLTLERPTVLDQPQLGANSRASLFYPVRVTGTQGQSKVMFSANAGGLTDAFVRTVKVQPLGFPQLFEASGTVAEHAIHEVDLGAATPGTATLEVSVYPGPLSIMTGGLAGLIREPHGCFEQTSSSNYPNVMVLRFLEANGVADPDLVEKTTLKLARGYDRLVGYETKQKGYEWFGASPPHEALTAYGVLQFGDMKNVYGDVDEAMIARTVAYLKSRRDGHGGFKRNKKALDSFGRASDAVTDAYITWAVAAAGLGAEFDREIEAQITRGRLSGDAYMVALAANTLVHLPAHTGVAAEIVSRLAGMQAADGAWRQADHSVTRSTGRNLHIETTSLALLALMAQTGYEGAVRRGVAWLNANRGGHGRWGATQATVLALKAMTEYTRINRVAQSAGRIELLVNGVVVDTQDYVAGRSEPLVLRGGPDLMGPGQHRIELRHAGQQPLPYSVALSYRSVQPASDPAAPVRIETRLTRETVKMGENVRLEATITNTTQIGQPMTMARVGFPGGLTYQTWQLQELKDKGLIAFYETRAREVILYFRQLEPAEKRTIPLDLVAMLPGQYTGPASTAYLYYTDDKKHWTEGTRVTVTR